MKKTFLMSAVLAIAVVGLMAGSAAADVINGDFVDNLDGWTVENNVIAGTVGSGGPAGVMGMQGTYALFGSGTSINQTSSLSQDFDIAGATELTLSFDWFFAALIFPPTGSEEDNTRSVGIDLKVMDNTFSYLLNDEIGNSIGDMSYSSALPFSPEVEFRADWGHFETTLSIADWGDVGTIGFELDQNTIPLIMAVAGIDNVEITTSAPVPEPATMLLFGTGLAGLAGAARRKKAQKK